ncbi:MAG: hypothetical protein JSR24_00020 [Proteobacteria bacterium]|nr:hypothetical protein [Pseudomonadota bacterium]
MDEKVEALRKKLETELPPVLAELAIVARGTVQRIAESDGWSVEQSQWIAEKALPPIVEDLAAAMSPEDALADGYKKALQAMALSIFEDALAEGKTRDVAFLMLVELEKQLALHRGEAPAAYSDALLMAGCEAVEAAAQEGGSNADQIETGFAMMRELVRDYGTGTGPDA